MTQRHSKNGPGTGPQQRQGQHDEQSRKGGFDPQGPHGGFGGAGGSQGSLYGGGPDGPSEGPSQQRLEHEAWQRSQSPAGLHGGVIPGSQGPYGDYGEVQDHRGGYWYGGQEGGQAPQAQGSPPRTQARRVAAPSGGKNR